MNRRQAMYSAALPVIGFSMGAQHQCLLGKTIQPKTLDHQVVPFKLVKAHTPEWKAFMKQKSMGSSNGKQNGVNLRNKVAPNWKNEDLYYCIFQDAHPHPVTKKSIWTEEEYKAFSFSPKQLVGLHIGELI